MIGAIDIGGTKIAVAAVDRNGAVLASEECATAPERGFDDAVERMSKMLRRCVVGRLEGIGIGCTGPVDSLRGWVGHVPFLLEWAEGDLAGRLAAEFGVPAALENDADAAALGELAWGAGKGAKRFIYVTISTGIGGGLVFDGQLYRGVEGAHPEIGHHVIDPSGPQCFCGAHGCWESLAGGPALAARAGMSSAMAVCQAAEQGDAVAKAAVAQEAVYLGLGFANLVTLYIPDVIAVGGGVMQSRALFWDKILQSIRENCGLVPSQKTRLVPAQLGGEAGLAGAAQVWIKGVQ